MKRKNRGNQKQKIVIIAVVIFLIAAVGGVLYSVWKKNQTTVQSGGNVQEAEDSMMVTYQGEKYRYNRNLKNIVFLGVDKREAVQIQDYPGRGGQSDAILLLVMNKDTKTTKVLQISRDSMVNLKIYDADGNLLTEQRGQLALQYAYGDGAKKSCRLSRDAVSDLLYGVPIHGFLSLNMDGIVSVVDALGGVPMTLEADYTYVDPAYQTGAEILLDGAAAERFVRYRDIGITGSNNIRMERQTEFLHAMLKAVKSYMQKEKGYETLLDSVSPYMVTDLTAEEMKTLSEYQVEETMQKVPGETVEGEEHDEYIVDDAALYEMVLEIFYEKVEK